MNSKAEKIFQKLFSELNSFNQIKNANFSFSIAIEVRAKYYVESFSNYKKILHMCLIILYCFDVNFCFGTFEKISVIHFQVILR